MRDDPRSAGVKKQIMLHAWRGVDPSASREPRVAYSQVILHPSAFILCFPYRTGVSGMIGFPPAVIRGSGFQAWP